MKHRTVYLGLALTMMIIAGLFSAQPFTRVSAQKGGDPSLREAYENEAIFRQLSSAAQLRLERMFGKKDRSGIKEASSPPVPFRPPGKRLSETGPPLTALTQVLVNDPTADTNPQDTQSETTIVLGSGTNVIASFNDSGSFDGINNHFTGFSTSANMGTSWTDRGALPDSALGDAGDPVLARSNSTGTIFLSTLGFDSDDVLQIFRSTNDGVTFGAPINGAPGTGGATDAHDKEWIAVDNFAGTGQGNVYMGWRDFGTGGGMQFTRSSDDGLTWGPNNSTSINAGSGQGAFVAVGPDHSVYYWWLHSITTPDEIRVRRSTDQGATFGAPVTVTTLLSAGVNGDLGLEFRSSTFTHAAVNPVNGHVYVVYADNPAGIDRADVFFRSSTDNGATWSAATRVNNDAGTSDNWSPTIGVTPDGSAFSVTWYDRRSDAANLLIQRWGVAATVAGGVNTFGPNFRISESFGLAVGQDPVINTTYMGDYDHIAADNTFFYHVWGDNRLSNAFHGQQPDARFAKVVLGGPGPILDLAPPPIVSGGNGNGAIDFNECNDITIAVTNNGSATATAVTGTLSTSTPNVTVTTAGAAYPDIPAGGTASNITPFEISTSPAFVCGSSIGLTLTLNYTGGSDVLTFNLPSGSVGAATRFDSTDVPKPINDVTTNTSVINVAGFVGSIGKVTVSFQLVHTFDADLDIALIGPDGTAVDLTSDNGGAGDDYGTNCTPDASRTTFDDAAATAITAGVAPFVGTFRPEQALSNFNGKTGIAVNGTWTLRMIDDLGGDVGTLNCWTLNLSPLVCTDGGGQCVVGPCTAITCPANITQSNDPDQCGAVVTFPAPTPVGTGCGTITCSPASGSFFPVGTTTVTCTASAGPTCTFSITVQDTQPPTITCPANITAVTALTCPATTSSVVTFPPPTATDNCPGVTVACVPPSGQPFPVGTTTVTCTATDASGNTATCSFTVTTFDVCLQDDSNPANKLLINSFTGDYRFICNGTTFTGKGKVTGLGCDKQLVHNPPDRRVRANWSSAVKKGNASIQSPAGVVRCTLSDTNMTNNDCASVPLPNGDSKELPGKK